MDVKEGLSGPGYSGGGDPTDVNTDAGFNARVAEKVAAKRNGTIKTSAPSEENGQRYNPDLDCVEGIKAQVHAPDPTTNISTALTQGPERAPEVPVEMETTFGGRGAVSSSATSSPASWSIT